MKLTLEPTESENFGMYNKVAVSVQTDDLTVREVWDKLIYPALLASTYQPGSIEATIVELADEITGTIIIDLSL